MYYAGIDIGGTSVKLGVMDENRQLVWEHAIPSVINDPQGMADAIAAALRTAPYTVAAAGISCAGRVDRLRRCVTASNLRWMRVPFHPMMTAALGCPVAIDNDVAGAMYGEWRMGAAKGIGNLVYFTIGTGIGSAMLLNGRPFRGHDNTAGEAGHMITHADGEPCPCGGHGCWERYASASALERRAGMSCREVFARAAAGDAQADAVLEDYVHELCIGLSNICCILYPAVIMLGGGITGAGDALLDRIRRQMRDKRPGLVSQEPPEIILATLGNKAGVIGGCMMAMDLLAEGAQ